MSQPWAGSDARDEQSPGMVLWAGTDPAKQGCSVGQGCSFTPGGRRGAPVHSLSCLVLPIPLQELPALSVSPANGTH